jgi:hypothetical protein
LNADSLDSAPPEVKKTPEKTLPASSTRRLASVMAGTFDEPVYAEKYAISLIWAAAASASSVRPCPTLTFQSPARPSRYSRPVASVTVAPRPFT